MHTEVREFIQQVKGQFPAYFTNQKVLEIGSMNINGTVRDYFTACQYTGIDLMEGPGVDFVSHAADLPDHWNGIWDVVISTEALEHDSRYKETLARICDLVKPGGLVMITCATEGREEHGTTNAHPEASPATNGWYQNIDPKEMADMIFDKFNAPRIICQATGDLYFWGVRA